MTKAIFQTIKSRIKDVKTSKQANKIEKYIITNAGKIDVEKKNFILSDIEALAKKLNQNPNLPKEEREGMIKEITNYLDEVINQLNIGTGSKNTPSKSH